MECRPSQISGYPRAAQTNLKKLPHHDPPSDSLPTAMNTNAFPIELSTVAAGDISKPPHVAIKALAPTKIGRAVGASLN